MRLIVHGPTHWLVQINCIAWIKTDRYCAHMPVRLYSYCNCYNKYEVNIRKMRVFYHTEREKKLF